MRTNIVIDDELMESAMRCCGKRTKRETVEEALRRMVAIAQQEAILELRGIGWDGDLEEMRTDKPRPSYG
jgi:Arc/MetJ family transcription regulator